MKDLHVYQIDAFASKVFHGNPTAVCPLSEWLPDGWCRPSRRRIISRKPRSLCPRATASICAGLHPARR